MFCLSYQHIPATLEGQAQSTAACKDRAGGAIWGSLQPETQVAVRCGHMLIHELLNMSDSVGECTRLPLHEINQP